MFKNIKTKILKEKAFTLVEALVSFSVIIILTAIILVNYYRSENRFALLRASQELAQNIRSAGEMAMSAREFQGSVPSGGYGIHIRRAWINYYILYADINGNGFYDETPNPTIDPIIRRINLERGVIISNILQPPILSINFRPPNPTIRISNDLNLSITNADIIFSLEAEPAQTKTIEINNVGLINVR